MFLYALTILLSSFLLFQIQPMFAKLILPWFGGSAGVWTTCMLFFQTTLLLGYLYAHWSVTRLSARKHLLVHLALLAFCVVLLPVSPSATWKPSGSQDPVARILCLLGANIGLPYLLLSTTGPLIQAWYAREFKGAAPYRLFALSNVGSALGLLTYPVLVEPFLTTGTQTRLWSVLFAAFVISSGWTAWVSFRNSPPPVAKPGSFPAEPAKDRPGFRRVLMWTLLAACASTLLLSITNHLTRDVAPVPFLWALLLFLYLLTFILCFDADGWYRRNIFLLLLVVSLSLMTYLLWPGLPKPGIRSLVGAFCTGLFVCCMVCHGELARLRPAPRHLTAYFLTIATGGALGGVLVGLVAPYFFKSSLELHGALVLCLTLAVVRVYQDPPAVLAGRPLMMRSLAALPVALLILAAVAIHRDAYGCRLMARSFYGTVRVADREAEGEPYRVLLHGAINHGEQWMDSELRRDPVTYFCPETGIGQVLTRRRGDAPWRVGIVGLGAGTLATYGRSGDTFRFYEINPLVADIARDWFTYLRESRAKTEVVLGDGRLSLEREPPQEFDVLAVDAFSSDSIPVHLLTREAFQDYFRHLKPNGVLAIQATNIYVNLEPLLGSVAASFGATATSVNDPGDENGACYTTRWVLIARGAELGLRNGQALKASARIPPWTDDHSNIFQLMR